MSLPLLKAEGEYKNKNLKAVRATFFHRESDTWGSFTKSDIDSYLTLVRRKIQEKCTTTQDLMNQIRRVKLTNGSSVTPNEFRYCLVKFGCILPQSIVDRVFTVFDSDRSGTMDFDEFAMWIMNSEFRPEVVSRKHKHERPKTKEEILQEQIAHCIQTYPVAFRSMKQQVNFMDLLSDIHNVGMPIKESEARQLFVILDKKNTGLIKIVDLMEWAQTGKVTEPPPELELEKQRPIPDLALAVNAVSEKSPKLLYSCFELIPKNHGVKMGFEEFRRTLMGRGLGQNLRMCRDLFLALGGTSGYADVDTLINYLGPAAAELAVVDISAKRVQDPKLAVSGVDRRLREMTRKSYKLLKQTFEQADQNNTGYIDSEKFIEILNQKCCPITYQDFRYIVGILKHNDQGFLNWQHFLQVYNPGKLIHVLDGARESLDESKGFKAERERELEETLRLKLQAEEDYRNRPRPPVGLQGDALVCELRRQFTLALKECLRCDPQRLGRVRMPFFVEALETAKIHQSMTPDAITALIEKYTVRGEFVDYLSCFRNFLGEVIAMMPFSTNEFKALEMTKSRDVVGGHPWDYGYTRERKQLKPYWAAASAPRPETTPMRLSIPSSAFTGTAKSTKNNLTDLTGSTLSSTFRLTGNDRDSILAKYDPRVVGICKKCHPIFLPVWRNVRNEFKRADMNDSKGSVTPGDFLRILEHFGVKFSAIELGALTHVFRSRVANVQDGVKYDEFLRVCLVSQGIDN